MRIRNTSTQYGLVSKVLHWSIALLMLGLVWLGWWMVELSYFDRWYQRSIEYHKALGMLVLALAVGKLAWMRASPAPALAAAIGRRQRILAKATHHTLVLMMLVIPVSGYLISTSDGKAVSLFGLVDIPAVVPKNATVRDIAIAAHYYLAYAMAVLAGMHILAALKHQFINRDGTLARMLWR